MSNLFVSAQHERENCAKIKLTKQAHNNLHKGRAKVFEIAVQQLSYKQKKG